MSDEPREMPECYDVPSRAYKAEARERARTRAGKPAKATTKADRPATEVTRR